jgi:hypothetical protein
MYSMVTIVNNSVLCTQNLLSVSLKYSHHIQKIATIWVMDMSIGLIEVVII